MKLYAALAILVLVIGLGWRIYYLGGENARLKDAAETYKLTLKQLKKDNESVGKLRKQNLKLSRRLTDAQITLAKVEDATGCFRAPVPVPAAIELRNLYDDFTGGTGYEALREGQVTLSGVTAESCLVAIGKQWQETIRLNEQLGVLEP